ncbi:nucleotidyltransferase [Dysgonomonas sp. ZJ279]|uniref:nucleotidyltransferase n=1 Tax=Dysgonomonas sp. ZJ279 TaxID=2709796 RepID=UPI0013ECDC52|nr:nucleotidyltransferase [Dysgonomonas sp. ZJ279]
MARTVSEIKQQMTEIFMADAAVMFLYDLQPGQSFDERFPRVRIESIFFYIVAFAIWTLETLFDIHRQETADIISNLKPHSPRWYRNMALAFQFGFNLLPDNDQYDNEGKTQEQIDESKIVSYAAVRKQGGDKPLLIKVAKDVGDNLGPLNNDEQLSFSEYMERVGDAGVEIEVLSTTADKLKLSLDIYYNPLVLNANGQRLDGSSFTPVPDAVRAYLKVLPFNGELVLAFLTDALQRVDGVVIPHLSYAAYQYGALNWINIIVKYQPYSGYFQISDADLSINYIAQSEILQ